MQAARCLDLGNMDYKVCWELQQQLFDQLLARKSGGATDGGSTPVLGTHTAQADGWECGEGATPCDADIKIPCKDAGTVLLVEHPPVYTLGKSGQAANLLVAKESLEAMGAQFFHIDRGGDVTFHGPGQLVCYPILDLEHLGIALRDYIAALEQAVIRTVATFGIRAGRIEGASGVWISGEGQPRKICAIGVRSSRYVTMHGFALNVTTDLGWFSRINPCGFTDRGVSSMARETGHDVSMDEVKELIVKFLGKELNVRIYK